MIEIINRRMYNRKVYDLETIKIEEQRIKIDSATEEDE